MLLTLDLGLRPWSGVMTMTSYLYLYHIVQLTHLDLLCLAKAHCLKNGFITQALFYKFAEMHFTKQLTYESHNRLKF